MPRVPANPFFVAVGNQELHTAAILAGNLSHECRNWLAPYATNDYPELQNIDNLNGQIEGQLRDLAGHIIFGLGEHCKRVATQIAKKNKYIGKLIAMLDDSSDLTESEKSLITAANESQREIIAKIDSFLMRSFMSRSPAFQSIASTTDGATKLSVLVEGLKKIPKAIVLGVEEKEDSKSDSKQMDAESITIVPPLPSTVTVDYSTVPSFAEQKNAKGKGQMATHLWNLARDACNVAHQIQSLSTRYLVSKPHQPVVNEMINLAGQIENQARASLRSISNFGTRPYNPNQMNQQISRQVLNQTNIINQKAGDIENKTINDPKLKEAIKSTVGALYAYVASATMVANALGTQ
eukprot:jgi/Bigna1/66001/fgenesh1_pg.1_\